MQFLIDENIGCSVSNWLRSLDYEVFCVYEQARGIDDDSIIRKAFNEDWIIITGDKDFGEKVYRENYPHHGVIFLRLENETSKNKIYILQSILNDYANQLHDNFIVVTEKQVRFAKKFT